MAHKNTTLSRQSSDELNALKESNSEADFRINEPDERKPKRKDSKKLFSKKESKDKGYATLNTEINQDSMQLMNKNSKKLKTENKIGLFKKSSKDDKKSKESTDDLKRSKHDKHKKSKENESNADKEKCLFGNTLENTVVAYPCSDGVNIPHPIRICLDIIEEKGLECEGIYRRHLNKSQMENTFEALNENFDSKLDDLNSDPIIAAAVVKKFLRELKSQIINDDLIILFDKCETISNKELELKVDSVYGIFTKLSQPNRDMFSYLIMHLYKIIQKSDINKMDMANVILIFQPVIKIKDRMFKFIVKNANLIFKTVRFKKYRYKINDDTISRLSSIPDSIEELENEIAKQETILNQLHCKIGNGEKDKQEQLLEELWALQRFITSLKRRVKKLKQEQKNATEKIEKREIIPKITNQTTIGGTEHKLAKENSQMNADDVKQSHKLDNQDHAYDSIEMESIKMICENEILIENIQQMIEKINKEKVKIFDLQQQFKTIQISNVHHEPVNYANVNMNEVKNSHEKLSKDNKQLEEKILLLLQKINSEKEKVFNLKFNIEYSNIINTIKKFKTNTFDAISKAIESQTDSDNGMMTKL